MLVTFDTNEAWVIELHPKNEGSQSAELSNKLKLFRAISVRGARQLL